MLSKNSKLPFLAGHTLNQNPVSCAGAIEALRYVEDHDLLSKSTQTGAYLVETAERSGR